MIPDIYNITNVELISSIILRLGLVFGIGLILVVIMTKFKSLTKTNVGQRYLSWLVIGLVFFFSIIMGGLVSWAFLFLIILFALKEIKQITKIPKQYFYLLIFFSIISVLAAENSAKLFLAMPLFYFTIITLIALKENNPEHGFLNSAVTLFVAIWVVFSLSHFILLAKLSGDLLQNPALLFFLGFAIPLSDVFAYFIGKGFAKIKFLDKYKIASELSPNKSYVGSLGNILGVALGLWLMWFALGALLPLWKWIIFVVVMGIMGVAGDITESMFKRFYKIKDSGKLLPGHGGMLDRIDSTLRIVVVTYYMLIILI